MVEDGPIVSAKYRLPGIFGQNWPTKKSHGLFATDKLLLTINNMKDFTTVFLKLNFWSHHDELVGSDRVVNLAARVGSSLKMDSLTSLNQPVIPTFTFCRILLLFEQHLLTYLLTRVKPYRES